MLGTSGSRTRLSLSEAEREWLSRWIRLPSTSQAVALRCRIVLECARGSSDAAVARSGRFRNGWSASDGYVSRIQDRRDRPRSGAPRSISEERVQTIVAAVLTEPPPHGNGWTKRTLAERAGGLAVLSGTDTAPARHRHHPCQPDG
ncbi:hypothetical protein SAMN04487905_103208 [Actinopolyspora xinjiangensis]|uniref:Homeodomain-like domain-containing protein n=1 Tax=Actinopolyspora xinjiangensis TaxID=405564 RepID=A0A1H0RTF9_9ACTN|nr:helix-turn-helix domain-containing protein [Actinopolyspora xinjiangensis]SDP32256.1 hypothetical protein SAMN04487905_103208 [Actinopolyspora xinjiangensis]